MSTKKKMIIVESPTKANTLKKILSNEYIIKASVGHIRDLPKSSKDLPKEYKDKSWAYLGIDIENDFNPIYITIRGKNKLIQEFKKDLKEVDILYLATDEDREGESISWHIYNILKPKITVKRMVFHEITKKAIEYALDNTRDMNLNLIKAQETRRIIDRLYGYDLSSLLWKKISYGLSAGRVQSPSLKMIIEKEIERINFIKAEFLGLKAIFEFNKKEYEAKLVEYNNKKLATTKDFNDKGILKNDNLYLLSQKEIEEIKEKNIKELKVKEAIKKDFYTNPPSPFITSTLQQESNKKLSFSSKETMLLAQKLYEKGYITYLRTDSTFLSEQAITATKDKIETLYGKNYISDAKRTDKKVKNSQEAHEAIRPAGDNFILPKDIQDIDEKERKIYDLIFRRTLASLIKPSLKESNNLKLEAFKCIFQVSFIWTKFDGYLIAYQDKQEEDENNIEINQGDICILNKLEILNHETKAPARYNEASLIKNLETEGIGRPSTYSSIISTLLERKYIIKNKNNLIPTYKGFAVNNFLSDNFNYLLDYKFTSYLEQKLDDIALGKYDKNKYLNEFYLNDTGLLNQIKNKEDKIKNDVSKIIKLPQLNSDLQLNIGKNGVYLINKNTEIKASIPEDILPYELNNEKIEELFLKQNNKDIVYITEDNEEVYLLFGRYGYYLQIGIDKELENDKIKKAKKITLPKNLDKDNLTEDIIKFLISLPKKIAELEDEDINIGISIYGFFLKYKENYCSIKDYNVSREEAIDLIIKDIEKKEKLLIKDFGKINKKNTKIKVSKRGLYIAYGKKFISIPKEFKGKEKDLTKNEILYIIKNSKK